MNVSSSGYWASKPLKLAYQVRMTAELELAFDLLEDRRPALLLETVAHPGDPVAPDPGQRRTAPQRIGLAQHVSRVIVVAAGP